MNVCVCVCVCVCERERVYVWEGRIENKCECDKQFMYCHISHFKCLCLR